MSSREKPAAVGRADMRAWLEAAISEAGAALPSAPPSSNGLETAAENPIIAQNEPADTENPNTEHTEAARGNPHQTGTEDIATDTASHQRKLVTVRRIASVASVNKTYSVVAVDGWKVVVEKAEGFAKGNYVLFFEVDAFLPACSEFEDLFAEAGPLITFNGVEGYRVGTSAWTDWRGNEAISQGHVCHLSDFPIIDKKVCDLHWEHIELTEENFAEFIRAIDFSDELGVMKWESFPELGPIVPEPEHTLPEVEQTRPKLDEATPDVLTSNPKVPSFIIKTDIERVQNCPNLFIKPKYQRMVYQESLKMDGASATIYFIPYDSPLFTALPALPGLDYKNFPTFLKHATHKTGRFGVCSRNQDPHLLPSKTNPPHAQYWTAALAANLHTLLPSLDQPITIQAELVGATIQGNPYSYPTTPTPNNPTHELFIFSITTPGPGRSSKRWHPRKVEAFAAEHGLRHVPVLGYHAVPAIARHHEDLVTRAELKHGEGLVFKNCVDGRWFKVLSSRWIREKGDEMHARAQAHLQAQAQGGGGVVVKGKGKGKGKGRKMVDEKLEAERKAVVDEERKLVRGWQMSKEEAEELMEIYWNLDEWMSRDEALRKWVEDWERGWYGGMEALGDHAEEANGVGNMENGWTAAEQTGRVDGIHANAAGMSATQGAVGYAGQNGQKAKGFGVSEEKRKELEDWLGIKEPRMTTTSDNVTSETAQDGTTHNGNDKTIQNDTANKATGKPTQNDQKATGFGVSGEKQKELEGWLFPQPAESATHGTDGKATQNVQKASQNAQKATQNVQKATGFGVSQEKRKELEDWLGIKGSAL
ncbi:hypothetical protein NEMBOFW57_007686 [Staphylotrichum longicolle]|uniref:RNA ligase domain-containing protein n=1 Tax=Staphylotrichum longicolle TaxID=669026 RepID=A0AAD4EUX5_9PEZI|nr:hypothetical protein NEMBOFW57_007686 [Staphylotrichum longicolle]